MLVTTQNLRGIPVLADDQGPDTPPPGRVSACLVDEDIGRLAGVVVAAPERAAPAILPTQGTVLHGAPADAPHLVVPGSGSSPMAPDESLLRRLHSSSEVLRMALFSTERRIGEIVELVVDATDWQVRYLVADLSPWVEGHALISPSSVVEVSWNMGEIRLGIPDRELLRRIRPAVRGQDGDDRQNRL